MFTSHIPKFTEFLYYVAADRTLELMELIEKVFPGIGYIHLIRANKVQQAISLVKALQLDAFSYREDVGKAVYSEIDLDSQIKNLVIKDSVWELFFDTIGVQPYRVYYEDLRDNLNITIQRLAQHFKLDLPNEPYMPTLKIQANTESREWEKLYVGDISLEVG